MSERVSYFLSLKVLCPPHWAGQQYGDLFVCGGCSRPLVCDKQDCCLRYDTPNTDPNDQPGVYG